MKLFAVMIAAQNPTTKEVHIYSREYDLSSFSYFLRGSIKDTLKFTCRETLANLAKGSRNSAEHEKEYMMHIQISENSQLGAYALCDLAYPRRIAYRLLNEAIKLFETKVGDTCFKMKGDENIDIGLSAIMKSYTDPKTFDALISAQDKADKIQVVLHENIVKLIERGNDLDTLVTKSKDLNLASKQFYKDSKKMNKKCCTIFQYKFCECLYQKSL